jgi:hypothetical protein
MAEQIQLPNMEFDRFIYEDVRELKDPSMHLTGPAIDPAQYDPHPPFLPQHLIEGNLFWIGSSHFLNSIYIFRKGPRADELLYAYLNDLEVEFDVVSRSGDMRESDPSWPLGHRYAKIYELYRDPYGVFYMLLDLYQKRIGSENYYNCPELYWMWEYFEDERCGTADFACTD